jgi:hypothetical protein
MRTSLVLIVLATLGCAAQTHGGPVGSRRGELPKMPTGANLPRWEHVCVASDQDEWLTHAGDEGWELVAKDDAVLCFKRPKVAPATTP